MYRQGFKFDKIIKEKVEELLKKNINQKSNSPWASPVVLVPKSNNVYRFCIDCRKLNKIKRKDCYPIPNIRDILDRSEGSKFFSKIDAEAGYYTFPMHPSSIEKTAFITKEGLYEFIKMPMGLVSAPATFQRNMDNILSEYKGKFVLVYLNDVKI